MRKTDILKLKNGTLSRSSEVIGELGEKPRRKMFLGFLKLKISISEILFYVSKP